MAVTSRGTLGSASSKTAATTLVVSNSTGAIIPAGTLVCIVGVWDNINSTTAPVITASTIGGTAPTLYTVTGSGVTTTAGSGIWQCALYALTVSDIAVGAQITTLTSNQSALVRAAYSWGFNGATATTDGGPTSGTSTSGAPSATISVGNAGDLVVGLVGYESSTQPTRDSDTTLGTWSTWAGINTTSGNAQTNVSCGMQWKVVTGAGSQTFNVSGDSAADSVATIIAYKAVPDPLITQAAYQFYADGTETGATALAAQDTAATVDVAGGDANLGLRVRVQETAGGPVPATDDWQLQWIKGQETLADSYPTLAGFGYGLGTITAVAQSFIGDGKRLVRAGFKFRQSGASGTTFSAALYAHDGGTFGDTGLPTGSPLATSTTVIPATSVLNVHPPADFTYFDFDASPVLSSGTPYFIALTVTSPTGSISVYDGQTNPHPGNGATRSSGGVWTAKTAASGDWTFEVYTTTDPWSGVAGSPTTVVPYDSPNLTTIIDSYPISKQSGSGGISSANEARCQSFLGNGQPLARVGFYLAASTATTGTLSAVLYAHTGTFGTGNGTGAVLATSTTTVNVASLGSAAMVYFDFAGTYTLAAGTPYVIGVTGSGMNGSVTVLNGITAPSPAGCASYYNGSGTWTPLSGSDLIYEVYSSSAPTTNRLTGGEPGLVEEYVGSRNATSDFSGSTTVYAQSFLGKGHKIQRVGFLLAKVGSPSGTVEARLYAHSGTFGTSSVGTGSPLAVSTPVSASVAPVSPTYDWVYFDFDGTYTLTAGTPYVIGVSPSVNNASNYITVGTQTSSPTHPGNGSYLLGTWTAAATWDFPFRVYTSFFPGKVSETGLVSDLGWPASGSTELLYALTLKSADLTDADTLRFRVLRNAAATSMTYASVPTLTASKVAGPVTQDASAALTATSTLSADGTIVTANVVAASADLTAVSTLAAGATVVTPPLVAASAALTAFSTLTTAGVRAPQASVALTATSTLTTTGLRTPQASAALTATSTLTTTGLRTPQASAALSATSTLTATATSVSVAVAAAGLTATSTLTATALGTAVASAALTATSTLVAAATVAYATFAPSNLSGLVSWYDADDASSFTYSSGTSVSQWRDKSTKGWHLLQANVPDQPSRSRVINGRTTVSFSGGVMDTGPVTALNVAATTICFVLRDTTTANNTGLISAHAATGSDWDNKAAFAINTGVSRAFVLECANSKAEFGGTEPAGWSVRTAQRLPDGTHKVWNNGTSGVQTSSTTPPFGVADGGILIGGRFLGGVIDPGLRMTGEVAEVVIYDRVLTDTERGDVETYLTTKWLTVDKYGTGKYGTGVYGGVRTPGTISASAALSATSTLGATADAWAPIDTGVYRDVVLADNPIAYFRLDEGSGTTMTDSSVNAKHGTYTGSPTFNMQPGPRQSGTAMLLNGTTQHGETPADPIYNQPTFTAEAWVKFTSNNDYMAVLDRRTLSGGGFTFRIAAGYLQLTVYNGGTQLFFGGNAVPTIQNGRWRHIAVSVDGTNVRWYLDGSPWQTLGFAGTVPATTDGLRVGVSRAGTADALTARFVGSIDEVAYYAGVLSAARIAAHWAAGVQAAAISLTAVSTLTASPVVVPAVKATAALTATSTLSATGTLVAAQRITAAQAIETSTAGAITTNPLINYCRNPNFTTGVTTSWGSGYTGCTLAVDAVSAGVTSLKATQTGGSPTTGVYNTTDTLPSGVPVTWAFDYMLPVGSPINSIEVTLYDVNAAPQLYENAVVEPNPIKDGQFHRIVYQTATAANRAPTRFYVRGVSASSVAAVMNVRQAIVTAATTDGSYFDGGTTASYPNAYQWNGTVGISSSTRTAYPALVQATESDLAQPITVNPLINNSRNPNLNLGATTNWVSSSTGSSVALDTVTGGVNSLKIAQSGAAGSSYGVATNMAPAMPEGTPVTIAFDFMLPVGSPITTLYIQMRDSVAAAYCDTLTTVLSGAAVTAVKDGQWHRLVYWTTVNPGFAANQVYHRASGPVGAHEWNLRRSVIAPVWYDGTYFDGDSPADTINSYKWVGTVSSSQSQRVNLKQTVVVGQAIETDTAQAVSGVVAAQGAAALAAASVLTTTAVRAQLATAGLTATSTLTADAVRQPQASASLVAASTLAVSAVRAPVAAASLTAASTLTTTAVRDQTTSVSLTSVATLGVSAVRAPQGAAALTAVASLSATAVRQPQATAALAAVSTLVATADRIPQAAASLVAASTLAATADRQPQAAATLTAVSTLTATAVGIGIIQGTVVLVATSTLSTAGVREPQAAAALTATSTLTTVGVRIPQAVAALVTTSTLSVSGVREPQAAAALTATSTLTALAVGIGIVPGSASLVATSTLSAVGVREPQAAASLIVTATLTAGGVVTEFAVVTMAATSTLTATADRIPQASASLVAGSSLTATAFVDRAATAVLTATSTLTTTAVGIGIVPGAAGLIAASTLSATALRTAQVAASLTAGSTLAVSAVREPQAAASLTATSLLTAAGVREKQAAIALAAASTLTATAIRVPQAAASLTSASTLAAAAVRERPASATLAATSTLSAVGVREPQAAASLTAASTLSSTALRTAQVSADLSATSTLLSTAVGIGIVPGSAALAAASTLSATAVRTAQLVAVLSTTSTLSAAGVREPQAAAALIAASTMLATADRTAVVTAALSATSTLTPTAVGIGVITATAALSATSTLTVSGVRVPQAAASLTVTSTLAAAAVRVVPATAALAAKSTLTVAGERERQAAVALVAASTLTTSAVRTRPAAADLSATSTLFVSAFGFAVVPGAAALSATSTLSAAAVRVVPASTALTTVSTLGAAVERARPGAAALTAASTLSTTAVRQREATATLSATAKLTIGALAIGIVEADADLVARSTLTAGAIRKPLGAAPLTASSTLAVTAARGQFVAAVLRTTATLSVAVVRERPSSVSLSAVATLTVLSVRQLHTMATLSAVATLRAEAKQVDMSGGLPNAGLTGQLQSLDADHTWYPVHAIM